MCGIAGVFQTDADPSAVDAARAMAGALRHRGPDGLEVWRSPSLCATLAHTRLSVFDASVRGTQPMSVIDRGVTITYNGAIYNFRDLRRSLEADGVSFRSNTDTEVILRLYERHGERCVEHLRGMYAFAIWDEAARTGLLARDVFGIKPLYVSTQSDRLIFASEIRAVVASRLVDRSIDGIALEEYFRRGSVREPRTLMRSVAMLPPGCCATWRDGQLTVRRRQLPPWEQGIVANGHGADHTRAALTDSIARHCDADVPVGVLLSGGIDSAAIAALASSTRGSTVRAFSLSFPGSARDEAEDARRTAARFGLRHEVLAIDAGTAQASFADYLDAIDQPSIDGFNTFLVARLARDCGVRVVLSGIGADELFGGYPSFWTVPSLTRWHRLARMLPMGASIGAGVARRSQSPRVRRVADLLDAAPSIGATYLTFRAVFTRQESRALVEHFGSTSSAADDVGEAAQGRSTAESVSVLELTNYVRNQLLRDADVMSMASGVELRTPYLDASFAATLWAIPPDVRIQRGKQLLRTAVPEIPDWTRSAGKKCFQVPIDEWFEGPWRGRFESATRSAPVPMQNWYRAWCVAAARQSVANLNKAYRAETIS